VTLSDSKGPIDSMPSRGFNIASGSGKLAADRLRLAARILWCLALPLLFFNSPGTSDVGDFVRWQSAIEDLGLRDAYREFVDQYPPLTYVALWLASYSRSLGLSELESVKLVILLSGYASTLGFQIWRPSLAVAFTALWVIYGMVFGYFDVVFAFPLLASLWCLERGRAGVAGALYAAACLVKWQPVIIGPFLLAHFWIRGEKVQLLRFTCCALVVAASVVGTFGMPVVVSFARAVKDPFVAGNALNLPWLISAVFEYSDLWGFKLSDTGEVMNKTLSLTDAPPPVVVLVWGLKAAFVAAYGYTLGCFLAAKRKTFHDLAYYSMAGFLTFFVFDTGVHENHLFVPALLALLLLYTGSPSWWGFACILAAAVLNLLLFYGSDGARLSYLGPALLAVRALVALLLVALCVRFLSGLEGPKECWRTRGRLLWGRR
jgi:hypothetical protein